MHKPRLRGMMHDEPGPGQTYALQARMAIAALREREPSVEIEIRWCPAHKGIPGNEVAAGWAKQAGRPRGRVAGVCQRRSTTLAASLPSAPEA